MQPTGHSTEHNASAIRDNDEKKMFICQTTVEMYPTNSGVTMYHNFKLKCENFEYRNLIRVKQKQNFIGSPNLILLEFPSA